MDVTDLVARLGPLLDGALVATDFDGTLAPLVVDPQQSRLVDGAADALAALGARGAHLAVITGRDAETVLRLSGLDAVAGLSVDGLYGLESWSDGTLTSPDEPESIETLRARLPELLREAAVDPDVWIEDKRLSLVVHARRVGDPDTELAKVEPRLRELAGELGIEVHPGAQVLELRLPGFDKGGAIDRLVDRYDPSAVLYLGDDLGDIPAFEAIAELRSAGRTAFSVGVRQSGIEAVIGIADVLVDGPDDVVDLFRILASQGAV